MEDTRESCVSGASRALRIAVLVHSLNAGGAQQRLAALANGFALAGHRVDFIAVRDKGFGDLGLSPTIGRAILLRGMKGRWIPKPVRGLKALLGHLKRTRPDILLAGSNNVHPLAVLAVGLLRAPPRLVLRASRHPDRKVPRALLRKRLQDLYWRPLARWCFDRADKVIAVSNEVAEALRRRMRRPERCEALPNPTLTNQYLASLRDPPPHRWLKDEIPCVLGVGRLAWQKDFGTLLDAMAIVMDRRPVRLVILGEGKERGALERQADALGIDDRVLLPGATSAVGPWMRHADLLVSSSLFEGSPGVLIEALAAGCPIVATQCPGGSAELLEGGSAGLLVPVEDPDRMAQAIERMLDTEVDEQELRQRAHPYREQLSTQSYLEALAP